MTAVPRLLMLRHSWLAKVFWTWRVNRSRPRVRYVGPQLRCLGIAKVLSLNQISCHDHVSEESWKVFLGICDHLTPVCYNSAGSEGLKETGPGLGLDID